MADEARDAQTSKDGEREKKLTFKEQRFVDAYVGTAMGNASKAAIMAGYSERSAGELGRRLLKKVDIKAAISERVNEYAMSAEEILARWADIARNSSVLPFVTMRNGFKNVDIFDESGEKIAEGRFIKEYKPVINPRTGDVTYAIEVQNPMDALDRLAKYHGLQTERQEITGKDGEPLYKVYIDIDPSKV